jgi:hypothetical protein
MVTNDDRDHVLQFPVLSPLRWLWNRRNVWERLTIALLAARITSKARRLRVIRQHVGGKTRWTMDVDAFLEINPELCYDSTVWPIDLAKSLERTLNTLLRSAP